MHWDADPRRRPGLQGSISLCHPPRGWAIPEHQSGPFRIVKGTYQICHHTWLATADPGEKGDGRFALPSERQPNLKIVRLAKPRAKS